MDERFRQIMDIYTDNSTEPVSLGTRLGTGGKNWGERGRIRERGGLTGWREGSGKE